MDGPALVGRQGQQFDVHVELGKIREFARATLSANPEYLDDPAPVAPPTFLITARVWQPPECSVWHGVDRELARVLHGEQEFVFHGPLPEAGGRLRAVERIDDVYEKVGRRGGVMHFTVITTEFRDGDGQLVAESRQTQIATSQAPSGD